MCSKSIVYDPRNRHEPILKIAFKDCERIYQWPGHLHMKETNVLAVSCTQFTQMLDQNVLAPYKFVPGKRLFLFNLHYGRVDLYLNQLCQLHRASSLHAFEQNDMVCGGAQSITPELLLVYSLSYRLQQLYFPDTID